MPCSLLDSRRRFPSDMASLATSSLVYNIVFFVSILCTLELYDWCWCGWKCICLMSVMAPCFLCLAELWLRLWLAGWLAGPWHNGSANGWASPSPQCPIVAITVPSLRSNARVQNTSDWGRQGGEEESSHCGNGSLKASKCCLKYVAASPAKTYTTHYNSQLTSYLNTDTHDKHYNFKWRLNEGSRRFHFHWGGLLLVEITY